MQPPLTGAEFSPIFDWSSAPKGKLTLLGFIGASALLHALCFYVFQIIYPPAVALLPPPARINLITPETEDGRILLRWIEAEDPALPSSTQRQPEAPGVELPSPVHLPSYWQRQPALRKSPPPQPDLRVPSSHPPAPVRSSRIAAPRPLPPVASAILFSGDIPRMRVLYTPELKFTPSTKELPQSAHFRIGVSTLGSIRYCFLERSSGDPVLDEQARAYLLLCRLSFSATAQSESPGVLWTTASVIWGSDIIFPAAAQSPSP